MGGASSMHRGKWSQPDPKTFSKYEEKDPAGAYYAIEPDAEIKVKLGDADPANRKPKTVYELFNEAVSKNHKQPALKVERGPDKKWREWTWKQYYDDCISFGRSLVKLGVKQYECVNIIGFNSPEWFIADLGAIAAGCKAAGIYTTNGPDACKYITDHSDARVVVVENKVQLAKFMEVRDQLPKVIAYVIYNDTKPEELKDDGQIYEWDEFLAVGAGDDKEALGGEVQKRIDGTKPGHCCTLIYTSGTTGPPKAVMISNDNATWTAGVTLGLFPTDPEESGDRIVSYLPLSHIAAQMLDIYSTMTIAANGGDATVWFARPDALKGTLVQTLTAALPTMFFGVPRVWEKMREKMLAAGAQIGGLKKKIGAWAKAKGLERAQRFQVTGDGSGDPTFFGMADSIIYSKIRERLGLTKCRMCLTGAAPISKVVVDYFCSLNIYIHEIYGMSECTGPQTSNKVDYWQPGSVGVSLPGCELKIDHDPSRDQPGEGEICYRGRHIMMGYMKNLEKTKATIDPNGWLHSGDVGRIDDKTGLVYITGRIKELIITAGGENIAPVPIEEKIKKALPGISNVMMVGDKRKYNTCLVTLKQEVDEKTGGFTDQLTGSSLEVNPKIKTVADAIKDETWQKYIQSGLDAANKTAVSNAQKVQKFTIVPVDFSVPGGELTPTLKLKRPIVAKKYADVIDSMYA